MINFLMNLLKFNFFPFSESAVSDKFGFYTNALAIVIPPDSLVLNIDKKYSEQELFHFYNEKMYFPYFGFNWNALRDCVTDASWITEKNIVIIHSVMPLHDSEQIFHYVDILCEAILTQDESYNYYIYFPMALKSKIDKVKTVESKYNSFMDKIKHFFLIDSNNVTFEEPDDDDNTCHTDSSVCNEPSYNDNLSHAETQNRMTQANVARDQDIIEYVIMRIDRYLKEGLSIEYLSGLESFHWHLTSLSDEDIEKFCSHCGGLEIEFAYMKEPELYYLTPESKLVVIEIAIELRDYAKEQLLKLKLLDYSHYMDILKCTIPYRSNPELMQSIDVFKACCLRLFTNDLEYQNLLASSIVDLEAAYQLMVEGDENVNENIDFINLTIDAIKFETIKKIEEIDLLQKNRPNE